MKKSIWIVFVIVSGFVGFLLGYSISAYTGMQKGGNISMESAGYGEEESGGYGGGGSSGETETEPALDNDALDYYQNLYQENQQ
ncbi:hypothetical protein MNBD_NITROSPINAE04-1331 [hydrothermal vent metagenome]|uniref:Uncharacterized protein n=1 Tax=hydrothermal vent metagenome TaxID=652676 RepID=A0A3B1BXR7_9ZZZZ